MPLRVNNKKTTRKKRTIKPILCEVPAVPNATVNIYVFYTDGTYRYRMSGILDKEVNEWKLAHSEFGPILLRKEQYDDYFSTDWTSDDMEFIVFEKDVVPSKEYYDSEACRSREHNAQKLNTMRLPYCINLSNKTVDKYERNLKRGNTVSVNVSLAMSNTEIKSYYSKAILSYRNFLALSKELGDERKQLNGVDKMGKKAKTQLIKRILESSENGKAVLADMGGIKSNVAQLLLDSTKK